MRLLFVMHIAVDAHAAVVMPAEQAYGIMQGLQANPTRVRFNFGLYGRDGGFQAGFLLLELNLVLFQLVPLLPEHGELLLQVLRCGLPLLRPVAGVVVFIVAGGLGARRLDTTRGRPRLQDAVDAVEGGLGAHSLIHT